MEKKVFELDFRGRKIIVEHGELAKQANAAVLVRYDHCNKRFSSRL